LPGQHLTITDNKIAYLWQITDTAVRHRSWIFMPTAAALLPQRFSTDFLLEGLVSLPEMRQRYPQLAWEGQHE
jgi:hypothetical protein